MASSLPSSQEIILVPLPHPGHIFPCIELANRLASRNFPVTIFLPESFIPSAGALHGLVEVIGLSIPDPTLIKPHVLEDFLRPVVTSRLTAADRLPPFAIVDVLASGLVDIFTERRIPTALLFTSSACSIVFHNAAALAYAGKEEGISIPGITDGSGSSSVPLADLDHYPPELDERDRTETAAALLVNTCEDLEGPLLAHMAREAGRPVWGVGPLLPDRFWGGAGVRDEEMRSSHTSSAREEEVTRWLDARARGSVVYVSFGTLDPPADEELAELGAALRESGRPFIWVAKRRGERGMTKEEMERAAGGEGMVIEGWAPQLAILRHGATGAYVCHCGWNSAVEAMASGVPVAAWPMCGDQFDNAWLLTHRIGVGVRIKRRVDEGVTRGDVLRGIDRVMADEKFRRRAAEVKRIFAGGFPRSSADSVTAFLHFLKSGGHHR